MIELLLALELVWTVAALVVLVVVVSVARRVYGSLPSKSRGD